MYTLTYACTHIRVFIDGNLEAGQGHGEGGTEGYTEEQQKHYAIGLLFIGTLIVAVFSDPMVDVIGILGTYSLHTNLHCTQQLPCRCVCIYRLW